MEPCQPGWHPGKREPSRFVTIPSAPLFRDGLSSRSRSLAPVFRFQLGLPVVGPDCSVRFDGLFHWGSNLDGMKLF